MMLFSTIIPTVGRPTVTRAVHSVLDQELHGDEFEIIVVNDSGMPLPGAEWHRSPQVSILETQKRERSIARNAGAAVARGQYLHFLDDDDWLLPGAFRAVCDYVQHDEAAWIYGSTRLVDRQGKPLIELHHEISGNAFVQVIAGEWIPLQSSFLYSPAFFEVGGFNPLLAGPEDMDLLRRIALRGDLAQVDKLVACVERGKDGSTTDYVHSPQQSRWAREALLSQPGAFTRMRESAQSSYWSGRVVRAYLTSMIWNARRGRVLAAAERAAFSYLGLAASWSHVLSRDFWRAVSAPYQSSTFARGFREATFR